jgi:hypothetical protein
MWMNQYHKVALSELYQWFYTWFLKRRQNFVLDSFYFLVINYNTSCSTGWRVNVTYHHLLELFLAEQAKGHIFSAKEDYLKSE